MTRDEFMKRLEVGLTGVSPEERETAVRYYTEYLDDAGTEREAEALSELGDPIKLAADIKAASEPERAAACAVNAGAADNFGEQGSDYGQSQREDRRGKFPGGYSPSDYGPETSDHVYSAGPEDRDSGGYFGTGGTVRRTIFIVFLVLLSPAIFGVGVAGIVLLLVPFIVAVALGFSTAVIIILGVLLISASGANGLLILGIALLLLAVTLMLVYAGVKLFKTVVPAVSRAYYYLYNKFTGLRGGCAQ